ncbi:hypothetical protein [Sphingomonas cavernae]|uniref:DUF1440 domain-containing protein n=1 Tax=Sphingomonas cavernae TaxID=2320861 RepID=A0A418WKF2_9SPHN|nr:hypothetical protein [Sphingomonas cavernae]RJF90513.1 hypothetical protein D3876_09770 [Sphingomonas cavernae]
MRKPVITAIAVAGTLDLVAAFILSGLSGTGPVGVLQFVASGPLGDAALANPAYALAGFLVHFAIMSCMVLAYMTIAPRIPALLRNPVTAGLGYGLLLWLIMYWIVRPLRWPAMPLPHDPRAIAGQLFCHLILVGLPIALIAARGIRPVR